MQLVPSAFLASAAFCSELIHQILPESLSGVQCTFHDDARDRWSQSHQALPPEEIESIQQISWDIPLVQAAYNQLLSDARSEASRACLLIVTQKESGAWLNTVPVTSMGLRM